MSSQHKQLLNLSKLASLVLEAKLSELSSVSQAESAVLQELNDLEAATQEMSAQEPDTGWGIYEAAHQIPLWLSWRRKRRENLVAKLARIKAEKQAILVSARTAFGRVEALETLAGKVETHRKRR